MDYLKGVRNSLKNIRLTTFIKRIEAYQTSNMTLQAFVDIEGLEEMLEDTYEDYRALSKNIQEELKLANADQAEYDAESKTVIQTEKDVDAARTIIKLKLQEWSKDEEERRQKKDEEYILKFFQNQAATQAQLNHDIISQVIAAISTAYSVPVAPGDVNLSPTASQEPASQTNPVMESILKTLSTSQFAAVLVPNPTPLEVSSLTTASCSFPNTPSYQSKENIQTEEKETGTASLPHPPKKGDSLSDSPDGPDGYPDKKRFERNEIKENNSFVSKLENSAKLDGAEKITS
jgi:hypothetical protein